MTTNADRCKAWREDNTDRVRQASHDYYIKNKKKIAEYRRQNREKNNAQVKARYDALPEHERQLRQKQVATFAKDQRSRRRVIFDKIKLDNGCQNPACQWTGGFQPYDLDFHHIDPETKEKSVGLLLNSSPDRIVAEMSKCTVLCAICHRRATHGDLDCSSFKLCEVSLEEDAWK